MTRNQIALRAGRLRRRAEAVGFEQRALHYIHRAWGDRLGVVRRAYGILTAWLPDRFRANKFLIVFAKRSA